MLTRGSKFKFFVLFFSNLIVWGFALGWTTVKEDKFVNKQNIDQKLLDKVYFKKNKLIKITNGYSFWQKKDEKIKQIIRQLDGKKISFAVAEDKMAVTFVIENASKRKIFQQLSYIVKQSNGILESLAMKRKPEAWFLEFTLRFFKVPIIFSKVPSKIEDFTAIKNLILKTIFPHDLA